MAKKLKLREVFVYSLFSVAVILLAWLGFWIDVQYTRWIVNY